MPIEVGIWKLGDSPTPVSFEAIESEKKLEEVLAHDIGVADPNLLLIRRQSAHKFVECIMSRQERQRGRAMGIGKSKNF